MNVSHNESVMKEITLPWTLFRHQLSANPKNWIGMGGAHLRFVRENVILFYLVMAIYALGCFNTTPCCLDDQCGNRFHWQLKHARSPLTICLVIRISCSLLHFIPPYTTKVVVVVVSAESTSTHHPPQISQQLHNHPLLFLHSNPENAASSRTY